MDKLLQFSSFALGGFGIALLCNIMLLRFARTLGIRNKNDVVIRWSNESKPSLGGVSFFVAFIFLSISYSVLFDQDNIFRNKEFIGLFTAGSLAFVMGLADDAYNTRPFLKLSVQILCGVLLVFSGTVIHLFHNQTADSLITVAWVVVVMNSLNMLDNMDGITGTTVVFILISCLAGGWLLFDVNTNIWSLILIGVIGAVVGFLIMNIPPSKLFMGDAGSQFIGLFVAFFGIKFLLNVGSLTELPSWTGFCIALVAFTPAAVDTLTVVINRLKKGSSPLVGGKDHTTHHLVYAGYTEKKVWYTFLIIGLFSTVFTIAMIRLLELHLIYPIAFFTLYSIYVFIILYRNTIKHSEPN